MNVTRALLPAAVAGFLIAAPGRAAVQPHGLFTDGAVLQQGMRLPVWGSAGEGEQVTVSVQGQKASTTARGGKWQVALRPLKAGGPFTLTIRGENTVEVKDILVGEVWVASGQSNMEWSLANTASPEAAINASADPMLRLITIAHATSEKPLHEVTARWREAAPETTRTFSAVAYYFARDLRKALKVPVGVIHTSWGGTIAEAWMSRGSLLDNSELRELLTSYETRRRNYPFAQMAHQQALEDHRKAVERARDDGRQPPAAPPNPAAANNPNRPTVLHNAMIAPLQPYAIRGAIWYQGESNAGRAHQYHTLFPAMIQDWRRTWGQGDFPFLFVQLAPFMAIQPQPTESAWAELREAQRLTTHALPSTGMAVITDVGEERDIHPRKKEPVGARLALAARALVYDDGVEYSGPTFESMKVSGDRAVLRFRHARGGLVAQGGELTGFTIAGSDRKWHTAKAEIRGDRVIVSSPNVSQPVAVRFGWANFPVVNLWNRQSLPASPFRTDDWPLTTQPK